VVNGHNKRRLTNDWSLISLVVGYVVDPDPGMDWVPSQSLSRVGSTGTLAPKLEDG